MKRTSGGLRSKWRVVSERRLRTLERGTTGKAKASNDKSHARPSRRAAMPRREKRDGPPLRRFEHRLRVARLQEGAFSQRSRLHGARCIADLKPRWPAQ